MSANYSRFLPVIDSRIIMNIYRSVLRHACQQIASPFALLASTREDRQMHYPRYMFILSSLIDLTAMQ